MAFFGGAVGAIYRQFSLAMVASMVFSAIMALSLTPALCATILKPLSEGVHHERKGFFGWFNRLFHRTTVGYERTVTGMLGKLPRWMIVYGAIAVAMTALYWRLPTSFLPSEDQGYILTNIQLPPGASANRTVEVITEVENHFKKEPGVAHIVGVTGFSFSGRGQNAGLAFVPLKDWSERDGANSADAIIGRAFAKLFPMKEAMVFPVNPPPIRELGNATGFTFRLQDRSGLGHEALLAAQNQLLGMAAQSKVLAGVRPEGMDDAPQLEVLVDRDKAHALGVTFADINTTLSSALGSTYINDFDSNGRQQRVIMQVDAPQRMRPEDINKLYVRNSKGTMVPFSAFSSSKWNVGSVQLVRYNGYPAMKISGQPAPGQSTGTAMDEMVSMMDKLPPGFGYEWTGQSLEEKVSGSQAPMLYALSTLAVFLCLAALYESVSIPVAVMLVVPLGVLGALLGVTIRGLPNDVYFKVGLIATIGLSAKNAILIIEFAKDLEAQGKGLIRSTLEAVRLRFRPIIMTSLAFILGVVPLVISRGAGSAAQNAIGTGVMAGMIAATVLAVFLVPVFFVVVRTIFKGSDRQRRMYAANVTKEEFKD
jgi:multidrug efflux pump